MRSLHFIKTSVGGAWAMRQARELTALGEQVHVVLPAAGPMVGAWSDAGAVVHPCDPSLPLRKPHQLRRRLAEIRRIVDHVSPDLIHSHTVTTTLAIRLALGRQHSLPRIFQVPGPLHLEHVLYRRGEIGTAGRSDYWIGSCRWTQERYRRSGVRPDRVFLSYYGTDLDLFPQNPPGLLRRELGLSPHVRIVGMVAHIYAPKRYLGQSRGIKGHEDLIDALAYVRRKRTDVVGVIIGGAWEGAAGYEARIRRYAAKRCGKGVIFLGHRRDVPRLYADFDVSVHPSHSENVGGAVESLLAGIPTIATDIGGFPDVVEPGRTGWLTPPCNPRALATALAEVLDDPQRAREMAREGQQRVRVLFDVRRTAAEVGDIYRHILQEVPFLPANSLSGPTSRLPQRLAS